MAACDNCRRHTAVPQADGLTSIPMTTSDHKRGPGLPEPERPRGMGSERRAPSSSPTVCSDSGVSLSTNPCPKDARRGINAVLRTRQLPWRWTERYFECKWRAPTTTAHTAAIVF